MGRHLFFMQLWRSRRLVHPSPCLCLRRSRSLRRLSLRLPRLSLLVVYRGPSARRPWRGVCLASVFSVVPLSPRLSFCSLGAVSGDLYLSGSFFRFRLGARSVGSCFGPPRAVRPSLGSWAMQCSFRNFPLRRLSGSAFPYRTRCGRVGDTTRHCLCCALCCL